MNAAENEIAISVVFEVSIEFRDQFDSLVAVSGFVRGERHSENRHTERHVRKEEDASEKIYEPYLMQIGMIDRTPRGRMATPRAYEYFGRDLPRRQPRLF